MRLSTELKVQVGFIFALTCLAVVGVVSFLSVGRLTESEARVRHTGEVIGQLQLLLATLTDTESAQRGYIITGDDTYLGSYRQSLQAIGGEYEHLRELTADNPHQLRQLAVLQPLLLQRIAELRTNVDLRQADGFRAAQERILANKGRQLQEAISRVIKQMRATEESLLKERELRTRRSNLLTLGTILGGAGLAFGFVALSHDAIRRDFAGRQRAEQALRAANEELELRVKQRTAAFEEANEHLRRSEGRLRAYVTATADVIYRMSPDWSEMRQLQGQEFLADTADPDRGWLAKYIYPDDQAHVMQVIREAIRTKGTFELEHRVRRADGTVGWTFSRAIPLLQDGEITEWFGAAADVTDRKVAQIKLQAQLARLDLLSQITRAVGERQDVRSIFQVVSRTLERQLPVHFCCVCLHDRTANQLTVCSVGAQDVLPATPLTLPERTRLDIEANGLARCMEGQLLYEPDLRPAQFPFLQSLVRARLASMVAAPLVVESTVFGALIAARLEPDGFSSGDCEFLRQVSEHVALASHQAQLHESLQRAYEDLRQTQQAVLLQERLLALGKMASGIAHDINNALSPIALYTEMLLESAPELSAETRGYLEIIQRAIRDIAQTVARMREFYRTREAQHKLLPVDLNGLVMQVLDLTRARWSDMAQQRGTVIEVSTDLACGLPAILGVESELRDALTNLIFNAVDAMPAGGQLRVRTCVSTPQGQATSATVVQLEMQDTGIGMSEETRLRCLEPFFTTKGERGTGLGLAMVYGTLQRHEAGIEIESALGKGTTVRLSFAVPTASAHNDVRVAEASSAVPSRRILLVDDDPLILKSLHDTLEADGHRVTAAEGGQAGIDAFLTARAHAEPYQVVVTDLGMPYVDGREVAAAVKSAAPGTLVLLLTGWGQRLIEDGEVSPNVDRILSKPPKLRELRQALMPSLRPGNI